jgi:membrane protein DedA with SNARE-associated domain
MDQRPAESLICRRQVAVEIQPEALANLQTLLGRWGYLVIFAGMLLENAGLPLPGETITLLGGYAAGSGQLNLFGVMAAAVTGAVLGDNIGYWLGRRFGWSLISRVGGWLRQESDQLEQLRAQFLKRAGLSVFLGRFIAVLRVLAGPLAGAVSMPYQRFLICNAAGALLWASTTVTLAWLGGRWIPLELMLQRVADAGLVMLGLVMILVVMPLVWKRVGRGFATALKR